MQNPISQFAIHRLIPINFMGIDLSFTNSSLAMMATSFFILLFCFLATHRAQVIPGRLQSLFELIFTNIADLLHDNLDHHGQQFFPFMLSLFLFVLMGNLWGLLPYQFTFTSHIINTFALATVVFLLVTLLGFIRQGWGFMRIFLPAGTPWYMAPFMIVIELISYLSRPISLSVRLFANMVAGHAMLKVFASFVISMGLLGVIPFAINVALIGFELLVAILQAYVFSVLSCIYLRDAISSQH